MLLGLHHGFWWNVSEEEESSSLEGGGSCYCQGIWVICCRKDEACGDVHAEQEQAAGLTTHCSRAKICAVWWSSAPLSLVRQSSAPAINWML